MNRLISYFLGPELYWIVSYGLVRIAARRHLSPDPAITDWLDERWPVLPLVVVPLTFALFLVPGTGRWWLLLRIDLAIAIGLVVATTHWCEAMIYHKPSAGPGAGAGWMLMLSLGYVVMFVGTVIAAPIIWWRSRVAA
jgi:hypothetical protein